MRGDSLGVVREVVLIARTHGVFQDLTRITRGVEEFGFRCVREVALIHAAPLHATNRADAGVNSPLADFGSLGVLRDLTRRGTVGVYPRFGSNAWRLSRGCPRFRGNRRRVRRASDEDGTREPLRLKSSTGDRANT